ncbi:GNAT family N-acetyltransferase [Vibrio parahaemolyticus]|uniref:GNAT family N-acetyltransferase n=1 Tax=Vibrio parahaemolyticus TaxID=670 RepID=UPI0004DAA1F1|nr:GNAT family N-acetyltransferase [Vibrio parahaemolyticus]EGR2782009.1 N-acetyltransferase [Vibrio parahaemolyticus]EGR3028663.1 N-acetyltransferase [Vibrio parahaemolyticus]EHR1006956.1 GNAT family N-acetyltransferase [Vibrio parahaemolyticus]EIV1892163.1 GNAT family N-acetyltransferase [Vibrio parahaemolyticus]EIZ1314056.1 GNAT family N-acetyltransferase [Vibrio parahaemolyticus]
MKTLTTERLILRLVSVDDAPFILELYNHPDFYRFVGDKQMRTDYEAARYIKENMLRMEEKKGVSLLVVEDKQTKQPLGICGLVKRDTLNACDIGYGFLPSAYGQGFAIEAAKAVIEYAKQAMQLSQLVAITNNDNIRSISLLKKLGFEFERVEQQYDNGRTLELYTLQL